MPSGNTTRAMLRALFIIAALWNFSGSVPGMIDPLKSAEAYFGLSSADYYYTGVLTRTFWICVFSFGVAYGIVAFNPLRHTGIVLMGIIGKVLFAANFLHVYLAGKGTWLVLLVAVGDVAFAGAFVLVLLHARANGGILS